MDESLDSAAWFNEKPGTVWAEVESVNPMTPTNPTSAHTDLQSHVN